MFLGFKKNPYFTRFKMCILERFAKLIVTSVLCKIYHKQALLGFSKRNVYSRLKINFCNFLYLGNRITNSVEQL